MILCKSGGRKLKPHYPLSQVKQLIDQGQWKLVEKAKQTAHALGYSESEAADVVASLEHKDFSKSETDFYNNASWQDYYSKTVKGVAVFIKLKIARVEDRYVLILSFKRDESRGGGS
jgi:motility quorum-sensing regulator / GCU-specific mRNA interferase toxin